MAAAPPPPPPSPREVEVDLPPEAALAAAARAAREWGAELEPAGAGGRLRLPVVAGIRRGVVAGLLAVERGPAGGARLRFTPEESIYYVHTPSVAVLLISALGGLLALAWLLYPRLLPVAPFGAVLALGGWFLVVSRLRNSGPEEFLDAVAALAGEPPAHASAGDAAARPGES
jgi:hypothetical protein